MDGIPPEDRKTEVGEVGRAGMGRDLGEEQLLQPVGWPGAGDSRR